MFIFSLIRIIGDTPLMLDAVTDEHVPQYARSKASEVMKQIIADLDQAISLFPEKTIISKYRFSYRGCAGAEKQMPGYGAPKYWTVAPTILMTLLLRWRRVEKTSGLSLLADFEGVTTVPGQIVK